MGTDGFYYVRNWWKYQHYRDRNPPWIKLHKSIQTDPDFQSLSEIEQWRLVRLWLVAADMDGRCPIDSRYMSRTWGLHRHVCTDLTLARLEAIGLISKADIRGERLVAARTKQRERQKQSAETEKKVQEPPIVPQGGGVSMGTDRLLEIWKEFRGVLPDVRDLSKERKRKCSARIASHKADPGKFLEEFAEAVRKCATTPFLLGDSNGGWKASFDWLIVNDTNYLKVLEGKYDKPSGGLFNGKTRLNDQERTNHNIWAAKEALKLAEERRRRRNEEAVSPGELDGGDL